MKSLLNIKNIAIAVLAIIVLLEYFNPGGKMPGRTVRIDGKKYEVIKHEIDTIEIEKTKIVTKKGNAIIFFNLTKRFCVIIFLSNFKLQIIIILIECPKLPCFIC